MIRMIPKSSEAQNAMRKCVMAYQRTAQKVRDVIDRQHLAVCVAGNQNLTAAKDLS
jgi:hypothetical protein